MTRRKRLRITGTLYLAGGPSASAPNARLRVGN